MDLGVNWEEPVHKHGDTTFTALGNVNDFEHNPNENCYLNLLNIKLPHTFYKDGEYNVCLNGHELYITESNNGLAGMTVPDGVTLNNYDETGDGLITITEYYADMPINTPVITVKSVVVNFYGGKIMGVKSSSEKGGVCVKADGTLNM